MKNLTKNLIIPSLLILFISFIIVMIGKIFTGFNTPFFFAYYNILSILTTIVFIVGSFMFITEQKMFNLYLYSIKHFRVVLSKNYRFSLMSEHSIDDEKNIDNYLKDNYLYKDFKYSLTKPLFYSGTFLFIILIILAFTLFPE